jgi:hypothetical protein
MWGLPVPEKMGVAPTDPDHKTRPEPMALDMGISRYRLQSQWSESLALATLNINFY